MAVLSEVILTATGTDNWKDVCCNSSIRIAYKWHHSRISLHISQTGTTQTAGVRNKGGDFIGQLCISVVPHYLPMLKSWDCWSISELDVWDLDESSIESSTISRSSLEAKLLSATVAWNHVLNRVLFSHRELQKVVY